MKGALKTIFFEGGFKNRNFFEGGFKNRNLFEGGFKNRNFFEGGFKKTEILTCILSYRWRESFNTVNRQIRDVITTGIDMCGRRMRKGGGGGDGPHIRRAAD